MSESDLLSEHSKQFASLVKALLEDARQKDAVILADVAQATTKVALGVDAVGKRVDRGFGEQSEQYGQLMAELSKVSGRVASLESAVHRLGADMTTVVNEGKNTRAELGIIRSRQESFSERLRAVEEKVAELEEKVGEKLTA